MSFNSKKITIVLKDAPWCSMAGQERLDLALAASAFGHEVSLAFLWDGVYQLLKSQEPQSILRKEYTKGFLALEHYEIKKIYVHAPSLSTRGLTQEDLMINTALLHDPELGKLLRTQDWVF